MNIAIDLTSLFGRKRTGVEIYAIDLYRALLTTEHTIIPIFHAENELDSNPDAFIIRKCNRLWLENVAISRAVRRINADICFFPVFPPPVDIYYKCRTKIFPTIHDTAFIHFKETVNFATKVYGTPKAKIALKKADGILTVSETVKKQLIQYTKNPVYNLGNIIAPEYKDAKSKAQINAISKWKLKEDCYYVSVSTIEPRKNMSYLLEVIIPLLKTQNYKLVLVGRRGWEKNNEINKWISMAGDSLVFTDYVSMDELYALYRFAHAFILLSKDEGFGRTPFEAVACGCQRIILSDIPIFHETFENNATFVPLDNSDKAREILEGQNVCVTDLVVPFEVLQTKVDAFLKALC
ncbi:MAG: glycosyltransferase family 4 protein [Bacteroidales bacterium]|nr:glycosyltransferase family 4 protein [Bacteroidales bacterium]MBR4328028.1 glycosyltransferase family 4 protein [Bacteroidales bacterium]